MKEDVKQMKRNNGITLVSLVITIIILILLASVVINLSENGLFNKVKLAKESYLNSEKVENTSFEIYANIIDYYANNDTSIKDEPKSEKEPINIPNFRAQLFIAKGGYSEFQVNVKDYNKLTIASRTYGSICGTTYWRIIAYKEDGSSTYILNSTTRSFATEQFDINQYNKLSFIIQCTQKGSSSTWTDYYYNNITISE